MRISNVSKILTIFFFKSDIENMVPHNEKKNAVNV